MSRIMGLGLLVGLVGLVGCEGDTGFTKGNQDVETQVGDPGLSFSPAEMVFEDLSVGATYSQTLTFEATGDGDLIIYRLAPSADTYGAFSVYGAEDTVTLAPGQTKDFTVTVILPEAVAAYAELSVQTNVSDLLQFTIPVSAVAADAPTDTGGTDTGGMDTGDTGL